MKNKLLSLATIVTLCGIFFGSVFYRIHLSEWAGDFNPRNPVAFYWTENALQYHYAEMIAQSKEIPDHDYKLQAPEGVKVFENLAIMMEHICGWTYRISGLNQKGFPFHQFTIRFIALCASLTIFAVYLCCRAIGSPRILSLLAAAISSFSMVSVGRSIYGFLHEDFALPLFFFGLIFLIKALRDQKGIDFNSLYAGGFFALSLASWHFSRLLFLSVVVATVLVLWFLTTESKKQYLIAKILGLTIFFPLLAGLIVPVLRSKLFFCSPAIAIGFGTLIGATIFKPDAEKPMILSRRGLMAIIIGVIILVLGIVVSSLVGGESDYVHVWSLFWNKIKHFGIKPPEPRMLDYPARSLWVEAFNSPNLTMILIDFFPVIIPATIGLWLLIKRKRRPCHNLLIILSLVFVLLYLAIQRMNIVANFFICVLVSATGLSIIKDRKNQAGERRSLFIITPCLVTILIFNFYHGINYHQTTRYIKILRKIFGQEYQQVTIPNWRINDIQVVYFIRENTDPDAIFLSRFGTGPLILTYTNRAIALQPKFEVRGCQTKVKNYLKAVYNREEYFYELCRKWQIDYFLYDIRITLDNTRDSDRWVADRLHLSKNSTAVLMQFAPQELKHFELIYQNSFYRLYRVRQPADTIPVAKLKPQPIYDIENFGNQDLKEGFFDDRFTTTTAGRLKKAFKLLQNAQSIMIRDPVRALQLVVRAREEYPMLIGSATILGIIYVFLEKTDEGLALCQEEVNENPYFPWAQYNLAFALFKKDRVVEARQELEEALRIDPFFEEAKELLRELQ